MLDVGLSKCCVLCALGDGGTELKVAAGPSGYGIRRAISPSGLSVVLEYDQLKPQRFGYGKHQLDVPLRVYRIRRMQRGLAAHSVVFGVKGPDLPSVSGFKHRYPRQTSF